MSALANIKAFLCRTSMPIWFSLTVGALAGIFGGVGTYFLVPWVNHELQMQRVKAEYLQDNIRELNSSTRTLIDDVTELSHKTMDEGRVDTSLKRHVIGQVNKLQWRVIELDIIFSSQREELLIEEYKSSASQFRRSLEGLEGKKDLDKVFSSAEDFSTIAYQLLAELYHKAGLTAKVDPELRFQRSDIEDEEG